MLIELLIQLQPLFSHFLFCPVVQLYFLHQRHIFYFGLLFVFGQCGCILLFNFPNVFDLLVANNVEFVHDFIEFGQIIRQVDITNAEAFIFEGLFDFLFIVDSILVIRYKFNTKPIVTSCHVLLITHNVDFSLRLTEELQSNDHHYHSCEVHY